MSLTAAICFSLGEKVGSMHAHTQLDFLAPFFWHFPIPADQIHNFCQSNSQTLEPDDFYGQSSQARPTCHPRNVPWQCGCSSQRRRPWWSGRASTAFPCTTVPGSFCRCGRENPGRWMEVSGSLVDGIPFYIKQWAWAITTQLVYIYIII